mgnify:FL=1
MSKYKIVVYAICKNEEENIDMWYSSMKEADEIIVLDTGSTDNSVNILKKYPKIKLYQESIIPWRFDVARNLSLSYVPKDTDICVCTDLDERFEKGWRKKLEQNWDSKTTRVKYTYNWSFTSDNRPGTTFYLNKIHTRNNYKWINPVHEVLKCSKTESEKIISSIVLNHYQKPKNERKNYLNLLELSIKENPLDDRNTHYLGREYMYYKEWDKCIETLHRHLKLQTSIWKDERCASMRYIAYSYYNKNYIEESIMWYKNAITEAPYLREPYFDLGYLYYTLKDHINSEYYLKKALKIKEKPNTYINEERAWNETIYDLLSINCFNNKKYKEALKYIKKALKINNKDQRLLNNYKLIKNYNI